MEMIFPKIKKNVFGTNEKRMFFRSFLFRSIFRGVVKIPRENTNYGFTTTQNVSFTDERGLQAWLTCTCHV